MAKCEAERERCCVCGLEMDCMRRLGVIRPKSSSAISLLPQNRQSREKVGGTNAHALRSRRWNWKNENATYFVLELEVLQGWKFKDAFLFSEDNIFVFNVWSRERCVL